MPQRLLSLAIASLLLWSVPNAAARGAEGLMRADAATRAICTAPLANPEGLLPDDISLARRSGALNADNSGRRLLTLDMGEGGEAVVDMLLQGGALRRLRMELSAPASGELRPEAMVQYGPDCMPALARRLVYGERRDVPVRLEHLQPDLATVSFVEELDPPVPPGADPGGVTVAQIDSGVNYLLPHLAARLARDASGRSLGYDYWDMDPRPFDLDTSRSPYFPLRHGTAVASILIAEAPEVRLLPYRYPRGNMERMAELIAAADAAGARIVLMPLGSNDAREWDAFRQAAEARSDMLFIVSAGNDGRNIDTAPVYPAAFPLANMITVTSADAFGRLAPGSNWGRHSVDLMVPGEGIETIDHRGAVAPASGSSFAVPRVAALAARLLARNPDWSTEKLIEAIRIRTARGYRSAPADVAWGWIPNPADDGR
ncbi:S8 family serine peptidase [Nisaea sediminum]|uniref:S8 family serine peptidase n=1 Tax=Nisaea sediminum TaxID=2775867 RepID=UPI001865E0A6|nr:S8 family serine peptidase [Nisaea sediminum]